MALASTNDTAEIRAASLFFSGLYFENITEQTRFDHDLPEAPNPKIDTYSIKKKILSSDYSNINRAFYLYLTALKEKDDVFFASISAYHVASILGYYYEDTKSVEYITELLTEKFPDSEFLEDIDKIQNYSLPSDYDNGFEILFSKATNLYENRKYDESVATLKEIVENGNDTPEAEWAKFTMARIFEEDIQDYVKSIELYREFLEEFPTSSRYWKVRYQIGRIYELYFLDYNEAKEIYEKIVEESNEQMWIFQSGLNLVTLLKDVFNKKKEVEKVYKILLEKVEARRDNLLYNLAKLKEENKKYKKAQEFYLEIIERFPDSKYFSAAIDSIIESRIRAGFKKIDATISKKSRSKDKKDVISLLENKLSKQMGLKDYDGGIKTVDKILKFIKGTEEINIQKYKKAQIMVNIEKMRMKC